MWRRFGDTWKGISIGFRSWNQSFLIASYHPLEQSKLTGDCCLPYVKWAGLFARWWSTDSPVDRFLGQSHVESNWPSKLCGILQEPIKEFWMQLIECKSQNWFLVGRLQTVKSIVHVLHSTHHQPKFYLTSRKAKKQQGKSTSIPQE